MVSFLPLGVPEAVVNPLLLIVPFAVVLLITRVLMSYADRSERLRRLRGWEAGADSPDGDAGGSGGHHHGGHSGCGGGHSGCGGGGCGGGCGGG